MFFIIIPYSSTFFNSSPPPIPMLYMFEVQIPVDAYPVFGLKRRYFLFVIDTTAARLELHKKRFDKYSQAFFLCFSYAALGSRRLIVTISGVRNNVALRFTTLTAEWHGRTNPLISTTFRTWRMRQVFFLHCSRIATLDNKQSAHQFILAFRATNGCKNSNATLVAMHYFLFYNYLKQIKELLS